MLGRCDRAARQLCQAATTRSTRLRKPGDRAQRSRAGGQQLLAIDLDQLTVTRTRPPTFTSRPRIRPSPVRTERPAVHATTRTPRAGNARAITGVVAAVVAIIVVAVGGHHRTNPSPAWTPRMSGKAPSSHAPAPPRCWDR